MLQVRAGKNSGLDPMGNSVRANIGGRAVAQKMTGAAVRPAAMAPGYAILTFKRGRRLIDRARDLPLTIGHAAGRDTGLIEAAHRRYGRCTLLIESARCRPRVRNGPLVIRFRRTTRLRTFGR